MTNCHIWFKHHAMLNTRPLFIVTCWEIWRNKNGKFFQQVKKDTWASVNSIFSYHSSIIQVLSHTDKHHIHRQVRWYPPKDGYIKVNMDGSSFGNPCFGGLLRNHYGVWIQGSCGGASNFFAELS